MSTGVPKNWGEAGALPPWDGARIMPQKHVTAPVYVVVPNFVALGQTVWVQVGVPKVAAPAGARPLRMGCGWPPRNTILSICYPTKFGRCKSNGFGIGGVPKNWGCWGPHNIGKWAWWSRRNLLLPQLSYHANFGHSRSNHTSVIMELHQKLDPHIHLSKSLMVSELTRIDWLPMTSY